MIFALAFLNMAALDLCWVGYNRSTGQTRIFVAVVWAMILAGLSGVNARAANEDLWNLVAIVLGAGVGTWVGLVVLPRFERTRKSESESDVVKAAPAEADSRKLAIEAALVDIGAELQRARLKFGAFHSAHEGFAVALEEVDELRAHVWCKQRERDLDAMRNEAIQAAAMFAAFAAECCGEESGRV